MLSAVSQQVHELLGGVVEHCQMVEPERDKLLQRLYALNIMLLEGMVPDVNLWTVSEWILVHVLPARRRPTFLSSMHVASCCSIWQSHTHLYTLALASGLSVRRLSDYCLVLPATTHRSRARCWPPPT